jgi:cytochrome c oxidase subunit 4
MADEHEEHIVSPAIYIAVLATLMLLLALTIFAAFVDLDKLLAPKDHHGPLYWNMTVALLIAICKAILIILFFMHVKYGSRLTWAFATAGFVWLGIMVTLTMSDYLTRGFPPGSPKSSPSDPSPSYVRPQPLHDPVVPGQGVTVIVPGFMPAHPSSIRIDTQTVLADAAERGMAASIQLSIRSEHN